MAALGGLVSDVDKAALTGEFAEFVAAVFRRAVSSGIAGRRDDDLALTHDWGFDLAQIVRPVAVWAGRTGSDGAVHARSMARRAHSLCVSPSLS